MWDRKPKVDSRFRDVARTLQDLCEDVAGPKVLALYAPPGRDWGRFARTLDTFTGLASHMRPWIRARVTCAGARHVRRGGVKGTQGPRKSQEGRLPRRGTARTFDPRSSQGPRTSRGDLVPDGLAHLKKVLAGGKNGPY